MELHLLNIDTLKINIILKKHPTESIESQKKNIPITVNRYIPIQMKNKKIYTIN